jgi:formate-dependent nitrite reductase membrane component NrfD
MTWGIWILSLFIPVALLYGFLELVEAEPFLKGMVWARTPRGLFRPHLWRRGVAIVGSVLAVGTAVYTGVLISAVGPAVPFWSQPILPFLAAPVMPVLFLVSALSTGLGATFDLAVPIAGSRFRGQIRTVDRIHILLVSLEAILIGLLLITSLSAGGAAGESARVLLYGPLKWVFWLGVVLVGLILPFVVHAWAVATGRHSQWTRLGTGSGTLVAGLFLRYLIVTAGIPAQL